MDEKIIRVALANAETLGIKERVKTLKWVLEEKEKEEK